MFDSMFNFTGNKSEIRRQAKALRKTLDMPLISRLILKRLQAESFFQNAGTVFSFHAFSDEVNLWPLTEQFTAKRWAFPRIGRPSVGESSEAMYFHQVDSKTCFEVHAFGMAEPPPNAPLIDNWDDIDVIFLPGLVFDRLGHRIGYGKGYYDRFIASLPPSFNGKKVGVVPQALLADALPVDPWDLPVDILVSELQTIFIA